jgi:hypothetical protein
MEILKGIRGYEACISQIRRQKTNLKSRHKGYLTVFKGGILEPPSKKIAN